MDKRNNKDSNDLMVESIKISYLGVDAEDEAKSLRDELCKQLHLQINPPAEIPARIVRLGVAEILITIILTTIAKTTLEAILDHLEEYFQSRYKKTDNINIQIVIKQDDTDIGKHYPFRLAEAKPIALKALFSTIRELVQKIVKTA